MKAVTGMLSPEKEPDLTVEGILGVKGTEEVPKKVSFVENVFSWKGNKGQSFSSDSPGNGTDDKQSCHPPGGYGDAFLFIWYCPVCLC